MKFILKNVLLVALITIPAMRKSGTRVLQGESDFFECDYAEQRE